MVTPVSSDPFAALNNKNPENYTKNMGYFKKTDLSKGVIKVKNAANAKPEKLIKARDEDRLVLILLNDSGKTELKINPKWMEKSKKVEKIFLEDEAGKLNEIEKGNFEIKVQSKEEIVDLANRVNFIALKAFEQMKQNEPQKETSKNENDTEKRSLAKPISISRNVKTEGVSNPKILGLMTRMNDAQSKFIKAMEAERHNQSEIEYYELKSRIIKKVIERWEKLQNTIKMDNLGSDILIDRLSKIIASSSLKSSRISLKGSTQDV